MEQCIAITAKKLQCQFDAAKGCYGLCRRHYNALTSDQKALLMSLARPPKSASRSKIKEGYDRVITIAEYIVLVYELYEVSKAIAGSTGLIPFLRKLDAKTVPKALQQIERRLGVKIAARSVAKKAASEQLAQKRIRQALQDAALKRNRLVFGNGRPRGI